MKNENWKHVHNGGGGAVYGLGLIGALFYFLPQTSTFSQVMLGIAKAIVWPAFFVYEIFKYLKI